MNTYENMEVYGIQDDWTRGEGGIFVIKDNQTIYFKQLNETFK